MRDEIGVAKWLGARVRCKLTDILRSMGVRQRWRQCKMGADVSSLGADVSGARLRAVAGTV
jgi:hypothetical protein